MEMLQRLDMSQYKTDIEEIGYETVDWVNLSQDKDEWRRVY
jgi:hypothetical protein